MNTFMELLYTIDGTLTRFFQSNIDRIRRSIGVEFKLLNWIWIGLTHFILAIVASQYLSPGKAIEMISVFLLLIFLSNLTLIIVGVLLFCLHYFFDRHAAMEVDKEYGDGYSAWSEIMVALFLIVSSRFYSTYTLTWACTVIGILSITYVPRQFYMRRRGKPRRRKKEATSDALQKLLERCGSWLRPRKPVPVPVTVRVR